MQIFTNLGIDGKLIIAQAINFVILLLILKKFVYTPLIKKIEEDEAKFKYIKDQNLALEKQKEELELQAKSIIKNAQFRAQKIVIQAEDVTKNSRETPTKARSISFIDNQNTEAINSLKQIFEDKKVKNILNIHFFQNLIKDMRESLPAHTGLSSFSLEYSDKPTKDQEKEIKSFIERTFGVKTKIVFEENSELIAGFKLSSGNIVIDQNLLFEIQNAGRKI